MQLVTADDTDARENVRTALRNWLEAQKKDESPQVDALVTPPAYFTSPIFTPDSQDGRVVTPATTTPQKLPQRYKPGELSTPVITVNPTPTASPGKDDDEDNGSPVPPTPSPLAPPPSATYPPTLLPSSPLPSPPPSLQLLPAATLRFMPATAYREILPPPALPPLPLPSFAGVINGEKVVEASGIRASEAVKRAIAGYIDTYLRKAPATIGKLRNMGAANVRRCYESFLIFPPPDDTPAGHQKKQCIFLRKSTMIEPPWDIPFRERRDISLANKRHDAIFMELMINNKPLGVLTPFTLPLEPHRLEWRECVVGSKVTESKITASFKATASQVSSFMRSDDRYRARPLVMAAAGTGFYVQELSQRSKETTLRIWKETQTDLIPTLRLAGVNAFYTDKIGATSVWQGVNDGLASSSPIQPPIQNKGEITANGLDDNPVVANAGDPDFFLGDASRGLNGKIGELTIIELIHLTHGLAYWYSLTPEQQRPFRRRA